MANEDRLTQHGNIIKVIHGVVEDRTSIGCS